MSPDVHMYMHFWYAYLLLLCEQWYLYNYIRNNRFVTYANTDKKTFWYYSLGVVHVWARWLCFSHLTCWLMLMIFHRILLFNSLLSMDWWFRSLRVTLFKYLSTIIYSDFSSFYISHNFENNPELCVPIVYVGISCSIKLISPNGFIHVILSDVSFNWNSKIDSISILLPNQCNRYFHTIHLQLHFLSTLILLPQ